MSKSVPPTFHGTPGVTDGMLVARAADGDRRAFDELVRRYQRQAVAVSYRLLGNTSDAMEIAQDAFLKAYTNITTLEKPEAFCGWFLRIVSNLSLNRRRGRKRNQQLPMDDAFGGDSSAEQTGGRDRSVEHDPVRLATSSELGPRVQAALDELPEKQRMAIILFTIEQMPQKDVAEVLECSVEAVKWHVFQGRKKLKELLKDYV
ncbi:MAG TPA: sigma-70 family RNA polymerase sigma factor [Tepidisphaeraceae bacterium]|nr:sigma-70 family RNA polymerase sigma factor [Tepidisphaeraceae bacterium]